MGTINFKLLARPILGLALLCTPAAAAVTPTSWEVGSEFNDTLNPSGVWQYGLKPTMTGAFSLMTTPGSSSAGNITGWQGPAFVFHNKNPFIYVTTGGFPITFPAHALALHPGPSCEYAVTRFVVPKKGKYGISGAFYGLDDNGSTTTTDVEIYHNGTQVFIGKIDLTTPAINASFTTTTFGAAIGDTIDFQVGCGGNGNYFFDTTGLNAVIERR